MVTIVLLAIGAALWAAWPWWVEKYGRRDEAAWREQRVDQHRDVVARHPASPSAHEALGDALRAAGRDIDAVEAYEAARERQKDAEADIAGVLSGGGMTSFPAAGSAGLEGKLRLAREDAARPPGAPLGDPALRPQVCRRCGCLSAPGVADCETCGDAFPADRFLDTLRLPGMKGELIQALAILAVMTAALVAAASMPREIKGVLLLATAIVLAFRFLRSLNGDRDV